MINKHKPNFIDEEDDGQYPLEDVEASRGDRKLQKKHPISEAQGYIDLDEACHKCGRVAKDLDWFYFRSPEETWEWSCGTEGWMAVCNKCNVQVGYFAERIC